MKKRALFVGALAVALVGAVGWQMRAEAAGTVLVRGIVKPGGASDHFNLYLTHVAEAPDPSAIRGTRTDVDVDQAKMYKWEVEGNDLKKVRTTALPVPEKEVVVRGTLRDDGRITASWSVQNNRDFEIEGTLQDRSIDTGFTDQGWVTVNVTSSKLRNVVPKHEFKEALLLNKDLRVRINGKTSITALGNSKQYDEVVADQQKVRIEGQVLDEDSWVASKFYEVQE